MLNTNDNLTVLLKPIEIPIIIEEIKAVLNLNKKFLNIYCKDDKNALQEITKKNKQLTEYLKFYKTELLKICN
jgi:hypothetical protein